MLIRNLADLHTEIGTTMPRVVNLLSDDDLYVRQTCVDALSKFAEHGKIGLYAIQFSDHDFSQSS